MQGTRQPQPFGSIASRSTIVHHLLEWGTHRGNERACTFLHGCTNNLTSLTFAQLAHRASAVAGYLAQRAEQQDGQPGRANDGAVLLAFEPGLEFVVAFMGCLLAQRPAVPVRPPRQPEDHSWLDLVAGKVGADLLLVDTATQARLEPGGLSPDLRRRAHALDWLQQADTIEHHYRQRPDKLPTGDATAFVQFTSGSTGNPKGVVVRHDNILDNQRVIASAFEHDQRTTVVGWLPHYHDMGLIGNILQPIYLGRPSHLMSPQTFLQRPMRWLRAIAAHDNVTSGGPNFAFQHCLTSVSEREFTSTPALDLSSWRLAFVGAEPVRAKTMQAFSERFAASGFSPGALYPCYGLAESTLMLAGGNRGDGVRSQSLDRGQLDRGKAHPSAESGTATEVVSCGFARGGNEIRVVDPDTNTELPEGKIGEVWARGPSIASGYLDDAEASEQRFGARTTTAACPSTTHRNRWSGPGPGNRFLRTGDLGFLRGGELFLTGRLGSLIVLNGRNLYPQDIEASIADLHPSFRVGGCSAFTTPATTTGTTAPDRLVIVQEVRGASANRLDPDMLMRTARKRIRSLFGVTLSDLVLTRDAISRTSSGKVRHQHNHDRYRSGSFRRLAPAIEQDQHA